MKYNRTKIKKYKGRLIELTYIPKSSPIACIVVGEITANTKNFIVFNPNKDKIEIILNYSQIMNIGCPQKV
jgi:hypothetical protein